MRVKRQHYVSAFYLAGFTREKDRREATLYAVDLESGQQRTSSPNNEGCQHDFYSMESADPQRVDDVLGKIEARIAPIIAATIASRKLPRLEDLSEILTFAALQHVRVPRVRDALDRHFGAEARAMIDVCTATDAAFEAVLSGIERVRGSRPPRASRIKLRAALPNLRFKVSNEVLFEAAFRASERLDFLLHQRSWSLLVAPEGTPDFVTSDSPRQSRELGRDCRAPTQSLWICDA